MGVVMKINNNETMTQSDRGDKLIYYNNILLYYIY